MIKSNISVQNCKVINILSTLDKIESNVLFQTMSRRTE